MTTATRIKRSELTAYEEEQVRRIAAWKSEPPNPLTELWKRISLPVARAIEKIIPDRMVRVAIEKAYDATDWLAGQEAVKRRAGVRDLTELKHKPLEECDALAAGVGARRRRSRWSRVPRLGPAASTPRCSTSRCCSSWQSDPSARSGIATGIPWTPARIATSSWACWSPRWRAGSRCRRERIHHLRELEDLLIVETQEDIVAEEALSFLFQLEIFEDVPGIGAASGAALNWFFIRRVDETARMVFQERWLRDNGRVEHIEPAEAPAWYLAGGWTGAFNRAAYSGFYCLGFGVTLPVYAVGALFRPMDNALTRGLRDGAAAAIERASQVGSSARTATTPSVDGRKAIPALARG